MQGLHQYRAPPPPSSEAAATASAQRGWFARKAQSLVWVVGCFYILMRLRLVELVIHQQRFDWTFMVPFLLFSSLFAGISCYLMVAVRPTLGEDYLKVAPKTAFAGTGSGIAAGACLVLALWPIYGILSIVVVFLMSMITLFAVILVF